MPPRSAKLAEDETDLRLFPPLRAGWARRGEPAPVPISGGNAKRVLFGAINIETGRRLFLASRRQRGVDFEDFLEEVHSLYRGRHVALTHRIPPMSWGSNYCGCPSEAHTSTPWTTCGGTARR